MWDQSRCRLCRQAGAAVRAAQFNGLLIEGVQCPRCGNFGYALDLVGAELSQATERERSALASYIRQANARGQECVELTADNWREYAAAHLDTPVSTKLELLLAWYATQSKYAGEWVSAAADSYPLVDAQNPLELAYLRET